MPKNPLLPKRASKVKFIENRGSPGILDDYAVRKNIASKEGTVEKVPVNDSDIVNLKYVGSDHPHQDVNTTATPSFITLNLVGVSPNEIFDAQRTNNVGVAYNILDCRVTNTTSDITTNCGGVGIHAVTGTTTPVVRDMFFGTNPGFNYLDYTMSLYPDYSVEFTGDLYFTGAGSGLPYADVYIYDNGTADTLTTGTWTQMTRFDTNGESNLVTPDHTNDHLTITKAGRYRINVSASFSGSGSVTFYGGVWKNNGATQLTNIQTHRKLGASGDVGCVAMSGIASLSVNDTLEIWIRQDSGVNKSITIKDCCLSCVMVGG